jgi:hypothetical protein
MHLIGAVIFRAVKCDEDMIPAGEKLGARILSSSSWVTTSNTISATASTPPSTCLPSPRSSAHLRSLATSRQQNGCPQSNGCNPSPFSWCSDFGRTPLQSWLSRASYRSRPKNIARNIRWGSTALHHAIALGFAKRRAGHSTARSSSIPAAPRTRR